MNQALVQDVVAEVMRRLGNRGGGDGASSRGGGGVRAGEDAPANDQIRERHRPNLPVGQYGVFSNVDEAGIGEQGVEQTELVL